MKDFGTCFMCGNHVVEVVKRASKIPLRVGSNEKVKVVTEYHLPLRTFGNTIRAILPIHLRSQANKAGPARVMLL